MSATHEDLAAEVFRRCAGHLEDYDAMKVAELLTVQDLSVAEMADALIDPPETASEKMQAKAVEAYREWDRDRVAGKVKSPWWQMMSIYLIRHGFMLREGE